MFIRRANAVVSFLLLLAMLIRGSSASCADGVVRAPHEGYAMTMAGAETSHEHAMGHAAHARSTGAPMDEESPPADCSDSDDPRSCLTMQACTTASALPVSFAPRTVASPQPRVIATATLALPAPAGRPAIPPPKA